MSRTLMAFFTFIFRVLFNFKEQNVFQTNVRGRSARRSGDVPGKNCDADKSRRIQQAEDDIRRHLEKLSTSKQRNIHQSIWCRAPCAVPSGLGIKPDCSNLVEEYQKTILTLKGQCDEKSKRIIHGNEELRRLKCVLMRTQRSDENSKRTLCALEAECRKNAQRQLGATRTVRSQAYTIKDYEKLCCHLVAELENIIGQHKVKPLTSHTLLGFVSHTLSKVVEVKRYLDTRGHGLDSPNLIPYDDRYIRDPSTSVSYAGIRADSSVTESVGTQTDSPVGESVSVQTDSSVGESVSVQTDSSVGESVSVQTDSTVGGESVGVQTDFSVRLQTENLVSRSMGVQTNSSVGESIAVQTDSSVGESISVQTDFAVGESVGVQTNTCFHQTVGVQTHFDGEDDLREITAGQEDYAPMQDIVAELLNKFGHDTRWTTNHYNLDALLVKVQTHGFQSLLFPELAFLHRKIGAYSAKLFEKYTPLLDLAKTRFSSLRSSTIRFKYDIVHIFSTLDTVLEIKNKELASQKINFTKNRNKLKTLLDEQTQKRISAENKMLEIRATNERLMKRNRP